jgi:hypothetical protein
MLYAAVQFDRAEMLLYNSIGPNPKVVRMFMAERGIEIPRVEVDLMGGENRREPYLSKNPSGQCPALNWTMAPCLPRSPRSALRANRERRAILDPFPCNPCYSCLL